MHFTCNVLKSELEDEYNVQDSHIILLAIDFAADFDKATTLRCGSETGDNPFGVRATAKAAAIIEAYPTKIASGKDLAKLQGIGKATVTKVS